MLRQASVYGGCPDPYAVHPQALGKTCSRQEREPMQGIRKEGSEAMKVRYYCCNCRENGEEDDNVVHDMYGYWDIESQSWVAGDLPAIEEYCGTCDSQDVETEEVKA